MIGLGIVPTPAGGVALVRASGVLIAAGRMPNTVAEYPIIDTIRLRELVRGWILDNHLETDVIVAIMELPRYSTRAAEFNGGLAYSTVLMLADTLVTRRYDEPPAIDKSEMRRYGIMAARAAAIARHALEVTPA